MLLDAEKYSPGFLASFLKDCTVPGDRRYGIDVWDEFAGGVRTEYEFGTFWSLSTGNWRS